MIGIGNAYRSDDSAGLIAARRVKEQVSEDYSVIEHTSEGAALMELWKGADRVIVMDAVRSGAAPGTVVASMLPSVRCPHQCFEIQLTLSVSYRQWN